MLITYTNGNKNEYKFVEKVYLHPIKAETVVIDCKKEPRRTLEPIKSIKEIMLEDNEINLLDGTGILEALAKDSIGGTQSNLNQNQNGESEDEDVENTHDNQ